MPKKVRLGDMLIKEGLITEAKLQSALREHKRVGIKLGEYLIRESIVREDQVIDLISRQMRISLFDSTQFPISPSLGELLPVELAQKYKVVALGRKGSILQVAMTDPMDINALDAIELAVNAEVEPLICTEQQYDQLVGNIYGLRSGLDGMMEDISSLETRTEDEEKDAPKGPTMDVEVSSLQTMAEEVPVIRLVNSILAQAVREKVSDVHISPEKNAVQIRFRIDGKLQEIPSPPKSMHLPLVSRLKILSNMDIANSRIPQDGRFTINMQDREVNVRVSSLPTIHGENMVLRLLDMSAGVYTLDRLGMGPENMAKVQKAVAKPYGMILATGPTGSGKSTSLYAILKSINTPDINIITLEDPVEYRVERIRQVQLNRRAGMTFASGLRSILRQDPDVVMVGEIRDAETAAIAIQAAMTGHRLLSTVHTNDSASAITRLIDMGMEPFLVSSVLLVSIAQRLVRRVCEQCVEEYQPDEKLLDFWGLRDKPMTFRRGAGCYLCKGTGYRGRVGLYEVLFNDEEIQDLTMRRASSQEIARAAVKAGKMRTLREDAMDKVSQGITTLEEVTTTVIV
ncbi:type II secretion system protein E (GspE) [Desulfonatronum thiosulfatophilum]|uniref:Type II secretion system protein E (GspE) n=1 Tax=Desulfonatronum thiosulfatophilum TaxID=617002 RepID=A0A1G6CP87_9BACT|nr:GspE/PulE family protein [Desulfonatronum thiosulfatophilum]SDB34535.1 type II secretion system protein E (GspE) [Desulfonatronum thiosulfatophilum]